MNGKITLSNLPEATAQDVFDQVATHLLEQNEKCLKGDNCRYRYRQLACAAGCLMSDSEYQPSFEKRSWAELVDDQEVPNNHSMLITELQRVHDGYSPFAWFEVLRGVSQRYDLKFSHFEKTGNR
jgi:hypothetical protein